MKVLTLIMAVSSCCVAFAHTQQEELSVVREMMLGVQRPWRDVVTISDDSDTNAWRLVETNYDSLFATFPTNHFGSSWTPQERRSAFENFVASIPELSTNGMYRTIVPDGGVALSYCAEHSQSNALVCALDILGAPHSKCKPTALLVFRESAHVSAEINEFVENILTNSDFSAMDRGALLDAYATILHGEMENSPPQDFTNGIAVVSRAVRGIDGALRVDKLLKGACQSYEYSSNRLEIAMSALSDERSARLVNSRIRNYFSSVTNQLLNASQPLVQLELP